ncbi:uncharacterized protein LOC143038269 [Oratosquilla oratoria]|uniref:uncharacterized protein LOC143038269 n=1 Tax=Oratosquilla oratoria TaxID=337810 RepID=UPI003F7626FB
MQGVMGAFGIGDRNADGVFLTDFCLRNQMSIMNTYYEHQESHKWSWYRWNSEVGNYTEKSMIDFFVTDKKLFRDVKSLLEIEWENLKSKGIEGAKQVIHTKKIGGKKTIWWTEDVKEAIKRKNTSFRKWMQRRNMNTRTAYVEARNEAERIKREAKKQPWEKLGDELERDI